MDYTTKSRFYLKQRITPLVNRYEFFIQDEAGKPGERVVFIEQKRLALKEKITAWSGPDKNEILFVITAEKTFDIHGKYNVTAADGSLIGYFKKAFGASLLRSTWELYGADGSKNLIARERNQIVALLRRVGSFVPFVGEILGLLPFNFDFVKDGIVVGRHQRQYKRLSDQYTLELDPALDQVDRRLIFALGVALDALQSR